MICGNLSFGVVMWTYVAVPAAASQPTSSTFPASSSISFAVAALSTPPKQEVQCHDMGLQGVEANSLNWCSAAALERRYGSKVS
jgi:hypothetical protein